MRLDRGAFNAVTIGASHFASNQGRLRDFLRDRGSVFMRVYYLRFRFKIVVAKVRFIHVVVSGKCYTGAACRVRMDRNFPYRALTRALVFRYF